jgi:hypothetical protein
MKPKFFQKKEWILIGLVVLVAIIATILLLPRHSGNTAVVTYAGQTVLEINLSRDRVYTIDADLPVTLEVVDGRIHFIHAQCPDKLCEGFGLIGEQGQFAICAPARVSVVVALEDEH